MSGPVERARSNERWFPLLFALLALAAVAPIFRNPGYYASQYDWRYFQSWIEVGRRSILWWHQAPLWNPYGCGGEVLLANPQSEVASPTFLLPLLFGTALGVKLVLWFYLFCAFDGMYRLGRDLELTVAGALLASVLFGSGGWLALHLSSGHSNFASAGLFPYLVLFYRRGRDDLFWAIPLGATAAWVIALGGTSTPAMATVLLSTLAAIDCAQRRSPRPLLVLLAGGACAFVAGAVRILPALEFAIDHPRRQWETDASNLIEMIRNGYWWRGVQPVPGKRYWFHEYGWRLAYITPPLILWSLTVKKTRAWWIVVAVGAGIVAGSAIPYGPWWLLKHLPIYRDLRVPSRYALLFALAFPILCGGALDDLLERIRVARGDRVRRVVAGLVVALALADGLAFDYVRFNKVFDLPMALAARETRFVHYRGDWRSMMNQVFEGHGALACDEEAPLERAAELDEGEVPQVRLLDPGAGQIVQTHWTQNRVELELALDRPTTVMVNQNWNEHWKATAGLGPRPKDGVGCKVVRVGPKLDRDRDGGRLGVEAPAGRYTLEIFYRPTSFVIGAVVSGVSLPLLLALFLWRRKRPASRAL